MPRTVQLPELPPGIISSDLRYPSDRASDLGDNGTLTFYQVEGRRVTDWRIATLLISKAGRRHRPGTSDWTYAVMVKNGAVVRIGLGPHVKQTVKIYISRARVPALQRYLDLHKEGAVKANQIRDRISSRRAQGQEERAAGNRYWRWMV